MFSISDVAKPEDLTIENTTTTTLTVIWRLEGLYDSITIQANETDCVKELDEMKATCSNLDPANSYHINITTIKEESWESESSTGVTGWLSNENR